MSTLADLRLASSLTLYEGLPHPVWESRLLADERARKRTVNVRGFPFYAEPCELNPQAASDLRSALGSPAAWRARPPGVTVEKQCGGFHPDYAVRWTTGARAYEVLICLGCGEARWSGPDGEVVADIERAATESIRGALTKYRASRPTS